ncbi:MAG: adenylate kinase [Firmicutes bacterium]|nr:adenylate kinase [Bacillota bacterium]
MLSLEKLAQAREKTIEILERAQIVLSPNEVDRIEIIDFGLGDLQTFGIQQLTYVDTDIYSAAEVVVFPGQICPEHRHPSFGDQPGKEQTFRCRFGTLYLYVTGSPVADRELKAEIPADKAQYFTARREIILEPGDQYTIPANTLHWFQAGPEGAVITEFSSGPRAQPEVFTDPEIQKIPQVASRGLKMILLGAPGSGKGTQARLLATKYGTAHLSMGNLLREEISTGSELGSRVAPMMSKGEMVPDSIVYEIIDDKIAQYNSYILDGFPRTLQQAEHLERSLKALRNQIDVVFLLDLPVEVVIRRLSGRRVCEKCSQTYHVDFYQSDVCNCGGNLVQRPDDHPDAIRRRMEVYRGQIGPLQNYYEEKGLLWTIDASEEMELTFGAISRVLDNEIIPNRRRK